MLLQRFGDRIVEPLPIFAPYSESQLHIKGEEKLHRRLTACGLTQPYAWGKEAVGPVPGRATDSRRGLRLPLACAHFQLSAFINLYAAMLSVSV